MRKYRLNSALDEFDTGANSRQGVGGGNIEDNERQYTNKRLI
jgi:hypothetical protein